MDRVGGEVARELGRFGPASGLAPIVDAWATAVGPEIARNAWPARLSRDGALHANARDSIWAFELTARADEIRERLGPLAPARIVFAPGPLPEVDQGVLEQASRQPRNPTAEHVAKAELLTRGIRDEDLRKVVAKTIAISLSRER
jgi:Dna[CI] antecedent, DciA